MSSVNKPLEHLLRLQHLVRAALRDSLAALDLTPVQNTVLHLIADNPGSSSAELARRTHVTPQTMHKLVTDLEDRELLALDPRPGHGRILDADLTDRGRQLLAEADVRAQAIEDRMTGELDDRQRQELLTLLQHCIAAIESPVEEEPPAQP
jgi:DNA-binding MarR family transcriptional regulator